MHKSLTERRDGIVASPYNHIPDELKRAAMSDGSENAGDGSTKKTADENVSLAAEQKTFDAERRQRRLIKYRRAGVVLSEDEVHAIKIGRRKLRREMKARGIRSKREFELTAGSLGLYFDRRRGGFLFWLGSHWLGALIGALAALLAVLFIFSLVQKLRGHFTINLSDRMFREGFTLSETVGFENPTTQLFAEPAESVPCISINQIPKNIDEIDGNHSAQYFAYTYYIRNEGESTVGYDWSLDISSETKSLSDAVWVMLFRDGQMRFFAKASSGGGAEALPPHGEENRGYLTLPIRDLSPDSDQFELVRSVGGTDYYRVVPDVFAGDDRITDGEVSEVEPMEVHKYTVVLWLEGDDPEATDDKIGGSLGAEMNFRLVSEAEEEDNAPAIVKWWRSLWN